MNTYSELQKIRLEFQTKEQEFIKNIIVKHLKLTNLDKEIYLRDMKGESWSITAKELAISSNDIYNSLKRTNHKYYKWTKEQENKTL